MKDDDLFAQLRKAAARDPERARAPEWERLAAGASTDEERRALAEKARAWDEEDAVRELAPIAPDAREAIVGRVLGARAPERGRDKVVPLRRGRVVAIATALAIAAAAMLAINFTRHAPEALPAYALAVGGGVADDRGEGSRHPDAVVRLGPDSRLDLVLRPARDVEGGVAIATALVRGGVAEAWAPPHTVSPTGAVRITGDASTLVSGDNGPRDLVVAVGRAGTLPRDPQAIATLASDARVHVFRVHVVVEGR